MLYQKFLGAIDRWLARHSLRSFHLRRFRRRERYHPDYRLLAASLSKIVPFATIFDLGCANGFLLSEFYLAGKKVRGLDLSPDVRSVLPAELLPQVEVGDFSEAKGRWDLVCCVEMAEHLTPERSIELVDKVVSLAKHWIYFSAAPPGQLGYGHINCRPQSEWLGWFEERGWVPMLAEIQRLRKDLRSLQRATWLLRNSFILAPRGKSSGDKRRPEISRDLAHASKA